MTFFFQVTGADGGDGGDPLKTRGAREDERSTLSLNDKPVLSHGEQDGEKRQPGPPYFNRSTRNVETDKLGPNESNQRSTPALPNREAIEKVRESILTPRENPSEAPILTYIDHPPSLDYSGLIVLNNVSHSCTGSSRASECCAKGNSILTKNVAQFPKDLCMKWLNNQTIQVHNETVESFRAEFNVTMVWFANLAHEPRDINPNLCELLVKIVTMDCSSFDGQFFGGSYQFDDWQIYVKPHLPGDIVCNTNAPTNPSIMDLRNVTNMLCKYKEWHQPIGRYPTDLSSPDDYTGLKATNWAPKDHPIKGNECQTIFGNIIDRCGVYLGTYYEGFVDWELTVW